MGVHHGETSIEYFAHPPQRVICGNKLIKPAHRKQLLLHHARSAHSVPLFTNKS